MNSIKEYNNSKGLSSSIIKALQDKKGLNILELDLRHIESSICDYFIICSGGSDRQVDALTNSVKDNVIDNLNEKPWHIEGLENSTWVLLDYINVVVHIFQEETRAFYKLEELWADAIVTPITHID